jgi:hypothetical protein
MSIYFKDFPKIEYKLPLENKTRRITNILKRFSPLEEILNNVSLYYDYVIRENETPEVVSYKFYDTMEYHWIILMFNRKFDPYYEWPMSNDQFSRYIDLKYGSEQTAKQTVKNYIHILQNKREYNGEILEERINYVDQSIYNTLDAFERRIEYVWDYEERLNEARRNIKIVDAIYIPQILTEKKNIF